MSKNSGFIGIMVASRKQRKYVLRQYHECNTTNMELYCFTPSAINWKRKSIFGLRRLNRKWVIRRFHFPRVVYNRCYDMNYSMIKRLERVIGSNKCFNHVNQFNKHVIHKSLSQGLVQHLPVTVPYDKENAARLLEIHKVLYFKPCYGYKGRGVYRVEMKDSGEIYMGHHHFLPTIIVEDVLQFQNKIHNLIDSNPYIIQQGINIQQWNDQTFDIRALVQKNNEGEWTVTNVVSRIAHQGCFNTSVCDKVFLSEEVLHHLHPPEKVNAIFRSIYDISLSAAELLETKTRYHLGELSVDFVLDNDENVWIIEVNGKPQKDLYDGIRKEYRVYKRPMEYARFLSKR
jgi:hypothetical protein